MTRAGASHDVDIQIGSTGGDDMKPFLASLLALCLIVIVAAVALNAIDMSASTVYSSDNVRLE